MPQQSLAQQFAKGQDINLPREKVRPAPYTANDRLVESMLESLGSPRTFQPPAEGDPKQLSDVLLPDVAKPHVFQPGPIVYNTEEAQPIEQQLRRWLPPDLYAQLAYVTGSANRPVADLIRNQNESRIATEKLTPGVIKYLPDPLDPARTSLQGATNSLDMLNPLMMFLNPNQDLRSPSGRNTLIHEISHQRGARERMADIIGNAAQGSVEARKK